MAIQDIADVKIDQPAALERFHTPIRPMDRDNCDISTLLLCPHLCGKAPPQYSASNPKETAPGALRLSPRRARTWWRTIVLSGKTSWRSKATACVRPSPEFLSPCSDRPASPAPSRRETVCYRREKSDPGARSHPAGPGCKAAMSTHKGGCFCGAVEIEVQGAPEAMGYCHCSSCRSWSAAPVNAFTLWKPENVRVTKGASALARFMKTNRSGRQYCTNCGGHIMTDHPLWGLADVYAASIPTLEFTPGVHVNYAETVLPMKDGLPKLKDFPAELGGSGVILPPFLCI